MRNRTWLGMAASLVLSAAVLFGQAAAPAAKQPRPKSQKEVDALMAIQNAQDADARIAAVENLITKFADTEFKSWALFLATASAEQKNDYEKMVIYAERTLEADPKHYQTMLILASGIANRTKEFDLDKEDKLAKAEKLANEAAAGIKDLPKPNPNLTDEQWEGVKKDDIARAHTALGLVAMVRKKYDVAITEFKTAIDTAATPDPSTMARLAASYNMSSKPDEAIAVVDKILALPDVHPAIKSFAVDQKMTANKIKSGAKPAGSAPAAPAQVEIKK